MLTRAHICSSCILNHSDFSWLPKVLVYHVIVNFKNLTSDILQQSVCGFHLAVRSTLKHYIDIRPQRTWLCPETAPVNLRRLNVSSSVATQRAVFLFPLHHTPYRSLTRTVYGLVTPLRQDVVFNTSASYSGSPGFKSQAGDRLPWLITVMMEAVSISETSVNLYESTKRSTSEDCRLYLVFYFSYK
jgi:hypothetical protein